MLSFIQLQMSFSCIRITNICIINYIMQKSQRWYGMEIFYLTKITEVQINDTINKYIMNMSGDYT